MTFCHFFAFQKNKVITSVLCAAWGEKRQAPFVKAVAYSITLFKSLLITGICTFLERNRKKFELFGN
jgi:hypothetical protein